MNKNKQIIGTVGAVLLLIIASAFTVNVVANSKPKPSIRLTNFSLGFLAQALSQTFGISHSEPQCPAPSPPNWANWNLPVPPLSWLGCTSGDPHNRNELDVTVKNNEHWGQMITVTGAPLNFAWESDGFNFVHDLGTALSERYGINFFGSANTIYLAPNQTVILGFLPGAWKVASITSKVNFNTLALEAAEPLLQGLQGIPVTLNSKTAGTVFNDIISRLANGSNKPLGALANAIKAFQDLQALPSNVNTSSIDSAIHDITTALGDVLESIGGPTISKVANELLSNVNELTATISVMQKVGEAVLEFEALTLKINLGGATITNLQQEFGKYHRSNVNSEPSVGSTNSSNAPQQSPPPASAPSPSIR